MAEIPGETSRKGLLARLWELLKRPSTAVPVSVLLLVGIVVGIGFWATFHAVLGYTNTEDFCISCHEMKDRSYADLRETIHFVNRTGTRAICSDCHVPHEFLPKMKAKIVATKDLFFHMTGKIDTAEKYEAHRLQMAVSVWDTLKASDSHECRNCHQNVWSDMSAQFGGAARHHKQALDSGNMTCIDCHQGIAHGLPKEFVRPAEKDLFADPDKWLAELRAMAVSRN